MEWENLSKQQKWAVIVGGAIIALGIVSAFVWDSFVAKENNIDEPILDYKQEVDSEEEVSDNYFVEITGHVVKPGIYELSGKILVLELIELAGGLTNDADLGFLHDTLPLSTIVNSEQKIYIPSKEESTISSSSEIKSSTNSSKISINNASLDELTTLTGIGDSTAQKIIDARPYEQIDDLLNVSGIGDATLEKIIEDITL